MSFLERTPVAPSDAELIARVRGGDTAAYGDLFERHREAATRLARSLRRGSDADDLVSESFTKVFHVLLRGGGPDLAFRAYLLTALRRLHVDQARATQRATPTDDIEALDRGVPFEDTVVAGFEGGAAARAYQSLPERWQLVLWHLEVEGQKPSEIAPLLGMSPNSVSVLAYRAREGLRQAFLQMHAADIGDDRCAWTRTKLGAYVRQGLSRRDGTRVEDHLQGCRRCTAVYLELTDVNSSLAAVLGPLVLGSAALAYLGGGASTGVAAALSSLFGRGVEHVATHSQTAVVAGAAAAVATVGILGVVVERRDPGPTTAADAPATATLPPDGSTRPPARTTDRSPEDRAPDRPRTDPATAASAGQDAPATTSGPVPAPPRTGVPTSEAPLGASAPRPGTSPPATAPGTTGPAPSPGDREPPGGEPSPSPEETRSAAVSVTGRVLLDDARGGPRLQTRFTVWVSGLAPGTTTGLTVQLSRPSLAEGSVVPDGCTRSGALTFRCRVTDDGPLHFTVQTPTHAPLSIAASWLRG